MKNWKAVKYLNKACIRKDCWDEYVGLMAIVLGIVGYIVQIDYTEETLDVSSFSIAALFLGCISELLFGIQGYLKGSVTITATRSMTFIAFLTFIVLWFVDK